MSNVPQVKLKPWEKEPNKKGFTSSGLKCRIRRHVSGGGHLCGYVGVDKNHPWYGKNYSEKVKVPDEIVKRGVDIDKIGAINLFCSSMSKEELECGLIDMVLAIDVHGGITYSDSYLPSDGETDLWWIGFDCAHCGDISPNYKSFGECTYKDINYVTEECKSLAKQLAAVKDW